MHYVFNCRYAIKQYKEHLQAGRDRMGQGNSFQPSFDSNVII